MQSFIFNDYKRRLLAGEASGSDTWKFKFVNSEFSKEFEDKNIRSFTELSMFSTFRDPSQSEAEYLSKFFVGIQPVYYTYSIPVETKTADKPLYVDLDNWENFSQLYQNKDILKKLFLDKTGQFYREYDTGTVDENGNIVYAPRGFYYIKTAEELKWCADKVNGESDGVIVENFNNYINIVLGDDIGTNIRLNTDFDSLKVIDFSIGKYTYRPFEGILFGNGFKFKNLKIICSDTNSGIIGNLGKNGKVCSCCVEGNIILKCNKKLTIDHLISDGTDVNAGILVGKSYGEVRNCYIQSSIHYKGFVPGTYTVENKSETSGAFVDYNTNTYYPNYMCINSISNIIPYIGYFNEGVFGTYASGTGGTGKGYWKSNLLYTNDNYKLAYDNYGVQEIPYPSAAQSVEYFAAEDGTLHEVDLKNEEILVLNNKTTGHGLFYDYSNITNTENLIGLESTSLNDDSISLIPSTGFNIVENKLGYYDPKGKSTETSNYITSGHYFLEGTHIFDNPLKLHPFNRIAYNAGVLIGCNNGDINHVAVSANAECVGTFVGFMGGLAGKWNCRNSYVTESKICLTASDNNKREYYTSDTGDTTGHIGNSDRIFSMYTPSMYIGKLDNKASTVNDTAYVSLYDGYSEGDEYGVQHFEFKRLKVDISNNTRHPKTINQLGYSNDTYLNIIYPIITNYDSTTPDITIKHIGSIGGNTRSFLRIGLEGYNALCMCSDQLKNLNGFTASNDSTEYNANFNIHSDDGYACKPYFTDSKRGAALSNYGRVATCIADDTNVSVLPEQYFDGTYKNDVQAIEFPNETDLSTLSVNEHASLKNVVFKVESTCMQTDGKSCHAYPFLPVSINYTKDGTKQTIEGIITTCKFNSFKLKKISSFERNINDNNYKYDCYQDDNMGNPSVESADVVYTLYVPGEQGTQATSQATDDEVYEIRIPKWAPANSIYQSNTSKSLIYVKDIEYANGSNNYHIKKKSIKNIGGSFGRVILGDGTSNVYNVMSYLYNDNLVKFNQYNNMKCNEWAADVNTTFFSMTDPGDGEPWIMRDYTSYNTKNCYFNVTGGDPVTCITKKSYGGQLGANTEFTVKTGMRIAFYGGTDLMYWASILSLPDLNDYTFNNRFGGFAAVCDLDSSNISDRYGINANGYADKYLTFTNLSAAYNEPTQESSDTIFKAGPMRLIAHTDSDSNALNAPFGIALPLIAEVKPTCLSIPSVIESPASNMSFKPLTGTETENNQIIYGRVGMFTQDQNLAGPTRDPNFWSINYNVDVPGVNENRITYSYINPDKSSNSCNIFDVNYDSLSFLDKIFNFTNITFNRMYCGNGNPGHQFDEGYGFGINYLIYSTYPKTWKPVREDIDPNNIPWIYSGYYDSKALAPYQYFGSDLVLAKYSMEGFGEQVNDSILQINGNTNAVGEYYNLLGKMCSIINHNSTDTQNFVIDNNITAYLKETIDTGFANDYADLSLNIKESDESNNTWSDNVFKYTFTTADSYIKLYDITANVILDDNKNGQFGFNFRDADNEYDPSNKEKNIIGKKEKFDEEEEKYRTLTDKQKQEYITVRKVQRIENTYKYFYDQITAVSSTENGTPYTAVYNKPYDGTVLHIGRHLHENCITDLLKTYPTVTTSAISAKDFDGLLVVDSQDKPVMYMDVGMGDCDGTQAWTLPCSGALGTSGIILEVKDGN